MAQVRTKGKEAFAQPERIVLWGKWISMIKPRDYNGARGSKTYALELMRNRL